MVDSAFLKDVFKGKLFSRKELDDYAAAFKADVELLLHVCGCESGAYLLEKSLIAYHACLMIKQDAPACEPFGWGRGLTPAAVAAIGDSLPKATDLYLQHKQRCKA